MKLSISNIAWDKEQDERLYTLLKEKGVRGIEIAPTRLFDEPYSKLRDVNALKNWLFSEYNLTICSMQSIWYSRPENIFDEDECKAIELYTRSAVDFAEAAGIGNIVFGCPKNRNIPDNLNRNNAYEIAMGFLRRLGEYAYSRNTVLSVEPNPDIYGTNFLNKTDETLKFVSSIACNGLKVNIDVGTMIQQGENPNIIAEYPELINHVHLSVPYLEYVEPHPMHYDLLKALKNMDYKGYVSVEMKNLGDIKKVESAIDYLVEFFGDG